MSVSFDQNYSRSPVPSKNRVSTFSLLFVMIGFSLFSGSIQSGSVVGTGLSLSHFLIAVCVGNIFLCAYTAILGSIGTRTGLNTNLMCQIAFGTFGSKIPSFILAITQTGWFGVGTAILACALNTITGIDVRILMMVIGLAICTNVFFGIKGLTFISRISVPAMLVFSGYFIYRAIHHMGGLIAITKYIPENKIGLMSAISMVIGSFISGGTLTADFLRYGKTMRGSLLSCMGAFFFGNTLMFIFGSLGAIAYGSADITDVMVSHGLAIPGMIFLSMNIWTTNDNGLYITGLAMSHITGLPSKLCAIVNGLIGTIFGLWMYHNFIPFLSLLSAVVPPIGGILIADYLIDKRRYHFFVQEKSCADGYAKHLHKFNILAVLALLSGIVAGIYAPGIASVNAVFISGITYAITKFFRILLDKKNNKHRYGDHDNQPIGY